MTRKGKYCLDCGKAISGYFALRCGSCASQLRERQKGHQPLPKYPNRCTNCNRPITRGAKRYCWWCYVEKQLKHPYIRTPEIREKNRVARIRRWQDPEKKQSDLRALNKGQCRKPNKPESLLKEVLDKLYPEEWRYVGDGSFWVGKLNPDFVSANGKKLAIELFGRYWHSKEGLEPHKSELGRIMLMNAYGYKCLVIWDDELEDISAVKAKIVGWL